jgi:hypothetical protein
VIEARRAPVLVQRCPLWVPVLKLHL